jgi:hypothetical protein
MCSSYSIYYVKSVETAYAALTRFVGGSGE